MDGSSAVHTLRWKQIFAGALSAASLIAGHLVFGQELQPIRQAGSSSSSPTAISSSADAKAEPTGRETLAPIISARPKPRPTASTPYVPSRPTGEALPPIVDGGNLKKPSRMAGATASSDGKTAPPSDQRPVATLQLAPSGSSTPPQSASSVSPWMIDINEALAQKPSAEKSQVQAASEPEKLPSARQTAADTTNTKAANSPSTAGNLPVVQFGPPQAATATTPSSDDKAPFTLRSAADLRKPSSGSGKSSSPTMTTAAPQLNPFTASSGSQAKPAAATRLPAIERSPAPVTNTVTNNFLAAPDRISKSDEPMPSRSEATQTLPTAQPSPKAVGSEKVAEDRGGSYQPKPTRPAAQHALPFENRYIAARPADAARQPHERDISKVLPPVTDAASSTRKPAMAATARASTALLNEPGATQLHGSNPSGQSKRLQLTGYETGDRAGRLPTETAVQRLAPTSSASSPTTMRFTQAEAPAQPIEPIEPAAEAPRPLPPGGPAGPFEMIGESGTVSVMVRRSMLLRTHTDIYRTAVVDPAICDVIQFTPREISIIGKSQGSTHVTFWFEGPDAQPITYLVKVEPDAAEVKKEEDKYKLLEDVVNEMFPDSKIQLLLVADKLIVKGQAKDSEEATQILSIIRTNAGGNGGGMWGPGGWSGGAGGGLSEGAAADVLSDSATGSAARARYQVINMLRVPGVQQVALRVKIAELNRTAARGFGVDVQGNVAFSDSPEGTDLFFNSILNVAGGGAPALLAQFDGDDISVGIRYLQQQGVIRLLSEPTLVTMSGRPATFVAGGEFAVPTVVGSAGLNAVTTDFRAFGAIISFLPTVVDKDRIRLEVSPEFSQINQDLAVNGTPGLRTRAVTTTVEMREGQTFAIAGLLEDNMNGTTIGNLPFLAQIFGRRTMQRAETELIILVTPELVHPMEAEEVPPLPGFDVTEPDNCQFFLGGKIEGTPTREYRSTVWPRLKHRYKAGAPAMTSGPFGHGQ